MFSTFVSPARKFFRKDSSVVPGIMLKLLEEEREREIIVLYDEVVPEKKEIPKKIDKSSDSLEKKLAKVPRWEKDVPKSRAYKLADSLFKLVEGTGVSTNCLEDYSDKIDEMHSFVYNKLRLDENIFRRGERYLSIEKARMRFADAIENVIWRIENGTVDVKTGYKSKMLEDFYGLLGGLNVVKKNSVVDRESYDAFSRANGMALRQYELRKDVAPVSSKGKARKLYDGFVKKVKRFKFF